MRPVERGEAPRDYTEYGDALHDLENRLGTYCSYCESRVPIGLAVEHKIPKEPYPALELTWSNFLLGCMTCNSVKGHKVKTDNATLWPDLNNTMLALQYSDGGFVTVSSDLGHSLKQRAQTLIDLVGLDRHPAEGWPQPTARDRRWSEREKVWKIAEKCRSDFEQLGESDNALSIVVEAALGLGFFSVWLAVFEGHASVRIALIDAVSGTARCCFGPDGGPIPRLGAEI